MASGSITSDSTSDLSKGQFTRNHHLNSALVLSPFKLDGNNYLAWSQACRMSIEANRMQQFINGTTTMPTQAGVAQEEWKSDNSMVKTWIFNSMEPSMRSSYMFLDTAYELWEAISQTFSVSGDMSKAYDIRKRIRELGQGDKSVAQYFAEINALWQELDHYRVFSAKCMEDAASYQKFVSEDRVVDFLAGLNIEFDQVRAQLIGQTPFPTLREAHARVQQEESRRRVMVLNSVDRSAMVASYPKSGLSFQSPVEKESRECDYCGGKEPYQRSLF